MIQMKGLFLSRMLIIVLSPRNLRTTSKNAGKWGESRSWMTNILISQKGNNKVFIILIVMHMLNSPQKKELKKLNIWMKVCSKVDKSQWLVRERTFLDVEEAVEAGKIWWLRRCKHFKLCLWEEAGEGVEEEELNHFERFLENLT